MIAQDFIIEKVMELTERFPLILCRYEWNSFSDAHYIEVSPKEVLIEDDSFFKEKSKIIFDFIEEYPLQTILFLAPDDLIKVKTPVCISRGKLYGMTTTSQYPELTKKFKSYNFGALAADLKKYKAIFPKQLHHTVKATEALSCDITKMKRVKFNFGSPAEPGLQFHKVPTCEWADSIEHKKVVVGESKFALSA